ncbi:MAG TPA: serine hydrolase domain-containing protein [Candidatus Limnocylindrales bacterium]|nr:serine hydrolase domain-containing protein [Candidatus Limnocylindrales bacterium]
MSVVVEPPDGVPGLDTPATRPSPAAPAVPDLDAWIDGVLSRRPTVGLAVAVVRRGRPPRFVARGHASIASRRPVTEDTVFRIGSVTKLVTGIAVMQLVERGLVDLDAPANCALRAYRLVPAEPGLRSPTLRHLLTHTAGIPEVVHLRDLFHPDWGPFMARPAIASAAVGGSLPSLANYYRGELRYVVEPGTIFAYSNHGFATVGQIVEDVTGQPLDRTYRERVFEPLGMADTDLIRSERVRAALATGYEFGSRGPEAVTDREWLGPAGGGIYSTASDMARLAAALLDGGACVGATGDNPILEPASLATMVAPSFQPVPQLPGLGLGCFSGEVAGHRIVQHDGLLPGFAGMLVVAPHDEVAIVGLTNGSPNVHAWLPVELTALLRELIGAPAEEPRGRFPQHPEAWPELCGRYSPPSRIADLRGRLALAGVDVRVRGDRLTARILTPIPALSRTFELEPDDPSDPNVFRIDLSPFGLPMTRVVFARATDGRVTAAYADVLLQVFEKRPSISGPSPLLAGALGAIAIATAVRAARGRARSQKGAPS